MMCVVVPRYTYSTKSIPPLTIAFINNLFINFAHVAIAIKDTLFQLDQI